MEQIKNTGMAPIIAVVIGADYSAEFRQVKKLWKNRKHEQEFKEHLKEKGSNGVPEEARYFFFLARKYVLADPTKESRGFSYYLMMNHEPTLNFLYYGDPHPFKKKNREELPPAQSEKELEWWNL